MIDSANNTVSSPDEQRVQRYATRHDVPGKPRLRVLALGDLDRVIGGQPLPPLDAAKSIEPDFHNQDPFYSEAFRSPPRRRWRAALSIAALSIALSSLAYWKGVESLEWPGEEPSSSRAP